VPIHELIKTVNRIDIIRVSIPFRRTKSQIVAVASRRAS
jgi:hypothetical protein